jgi:hypothetical protein
MGSTRVRDRRSGTSATSGPSEWHVHSRRSTIASMRILLTKISDQRHALEIVREDGSRETVELVTREALFHDMLHHAVESALPTQGGFWGALASGKTMLDPNDRTGESVKKNADTLYRVEGIVGVMSSVVEMPLTQAFAKLRWFSESQEQELPAWCTESFVAEVSERMRRLQGQWKATPYGESMEIAWVRTGAE